MSLLFFWSVPQITTFGCTYLYVHVMYCIVSYHGEKRMDMIWGLGKGCAKMDGLILTIYTSSCFLGSMFTVYNLLFRFQLLLTWKLAH